MSSSRTTTSADAPEAMLQACTALSVELNQFITQYQKDPAVLRQARESLACILPELKQAQDDVERYLLQCLGRKRSMDLPGGWTLKSTIGRKEVVDQDAERDAYASILAQHAIDTESGEVTLAVEHARRIVDILVAIMCATKPKKQALKAHRINPETVFYYEPTDPKVELVEPKVSHPNLKMVRGGDAA